MQTARPVCQSGLTRITCVQHRTRDQVHIHLPGVLLNGDDEQVFGQLFCTVLGIEEVLWSTFFLRILFTASFINLRQSSHWHSRKSSGLKPHCHPATISKGLLLIFVLFLCAYQFDCHWSHPWLSIPAILAIPSSFFWCFHMNISIHNSFREILTFLLWNLHFLWFFHVMFMILKAKHSIYKFYVALGAQNQTWSPQ